MNFKDIEKIIELFSQKKITKLSLKQGDVELHLENNPGSIPNSALPVAQPQTLPQSSPLPSPTIDIVSSQTDQNDGVFIESPMVGTFYRCPSPNADPYIKVGDKIKKGQVIGIIEAMKIMNEIEAEFDCTIVEIIANDAQPVEFGSKLIKIEKI